MYTKHNYGFWVTVMWSIKPFLWGGLYAGIICAIYCIMKSYTGINIALPWSPIGIVGIAVAFYLGFKNNASYDRLWEARKIWGGIVNNSRSFGAAANAFVSGDNKEAEVKQLLYRHIAWLTALRFQLRLSREWEHHEERVKGIFPTPCENYLGDLSAGLQQFVSKEEADACMGKANAATQLLAIQETELQRLYEAGYLDDFRHMELHKLITTFYDDQGRSERIKNFPFPRQYASTAVWLSFIFAALIPFGLLDILGTMSHLKQLIVVPISALTIWVFFLMEKIGDYSENPFEGSYNDIPITALSRTIEIDLREMIGDSNIPEPIKADDGYLM